MSTPLDPERPGKFSSSLVAGLAILRCFTAEHPVRGIAEIAMELDMSSSTTPYTTTLVMLGFLERGPSRKYRLLSRRGPRALAVWLDGDPLRGSGTSGGVEGADRAHRELGGFVGYLGCVYRSLAGGSPRAVRGRCRYRVGFEPARPLHRRG